MWTARKLVNETTRVIEFLIESVALAKLVLVGVQKGETISDCTQRVSLLGPAWFALGHSLGGGVTLVSGVRVVMTDMQADMVLLTCSNSPGLIPRIGVICC